VAANQRRLTRKCKSQMEVQAAASSDAGCFTLTWCPLIILALAWEEKGSFQLSINVRRVNESTNCHPATVPPAGVIISPYSTKQWGDRREMIRRDGKRERRAPLKDQRRPSPYKSNPFYWSNLARRRSQVFQDDSKSAKTFCHRILSWRRGNGSR